MFTGDEILQKLATYNRPRAKPCIFFWTLIYCGVSKTVTVSPRFFFFYIHSNNVVQFCTAVSYSELIRK